MYIIVYWRLKNVIHVGLTWNYEWISLDVGLDTTSQRPFQTVPVFVSLFHEPMKYKGLSSMCEVFQTCYVGVDGYVADCDGYVPRFLRLRHLSALNSEVLLFDTAEHWGKLESNSSVAFTFFQTCAINLLRKVTWFYIAQASLEVLLLIQVRGWIKKSLVKSTSHFFLLWKALLYPVMFIAVRTPKHLMPI